jgi:plastocyanin
MLSLSRFILASSLVSSALAATFQVEVGKGGLTFTPNQVSGVAGDEVIFTFTAKNHTVTQSTLAIPCAPVAGGGDSGFMPVAAGSTVLPTKRIVIPDATTPLWFYCKQANHCQQGMVFAINPGTQAKMDTFLANAKAAAAPPAATPPAATTPPAAETTAPAPTPDATTPPGTTTAPAPDAQPSAPVGTGKEIIVAVGQGGLTFNPETVTAVAGDTIVFQFMGGAHTVTQSTFAAPCVKSAGGIDSGPVPAAGLTSNFPNFTYPVTDASKPLWFYCATGSHCRSGMVFSINAPATGNTAAAYKALAMGGSAAGGASVSGSGSLTAGGPQQTGAPGDGASSLVGSASGLLMAAALAALLL